ARRTYRSRRGSWRRGTIESTVQLVKQTQQVFLVLLGEAAEQFGNAADAQGLIVKEGLLAGGGEADVDLALVAGVNTAGDEGTVAVLQRADDARHLRW